ncbi:MAG: hypothetical protein QM706_18090 [Nitrospira sp.]
MVKSISARCNIADYAVAPFATAQTPPDSANEVNQQLIHSLAVEAMIWGMPAVNYERMLQAAER